MIVRCSECGSQISDRAAVCPRCGCPYRWAAEMRITDIHMPFMSMVEFMVKWTIALIPAVLVLALLATIVVEVVPLLF